MKIAIITSSTSGTGASEEKEKLINDAFKDLDVEFELFILKSDEIENKVKQLKETDIDAIIAGGGDGTVSMIAEVLCGSDIPMGVLPLGTLNHFAKDLGIPLDINEAAAIIVRGNVKKVDMAEVNGRKFLNNSSIGLYPSMVRKRDRVLSNGGKSKWVSMVASSVHTLKKHSRFNVTIEAPENKAMNISTYFVFVGNNKYKMEFLNPGIRDRLDEGVLTLCVARCKTKLCLIKLSFKAIFNMLDNEKDFEMHFVKEVKLSSGKKNVNVSMDGEVINLNSPLDYKILPGILPVIVP